MYRPPGPYTAFLIEFPKFLSDLVVIADNILIFGDFNIHMEKSTHSKRLLEPSSTQWVLSNMSPDLHIVSSVINIVELNVFPHNPGLLDRHLIKFAIATNNLRIIKIAL